jgi:fermentation-respiration switch protein FrsA (DUF1100 family)
MTNRIDIEFSGEDGVVLRGWLYRSEHTPSRPRPAITMAHGFAAVKEHGLDRFAQLFAQSGFVVLVHDHRGFGASEGSPSQDIDPWRQIADWRCAISYLESRPEVDGTRLGIWGTSFAGGHSIVLGATDRRIRCVVAQVPTISGFEQGRRRVAPDATMALEAAFADDERAALHCVPRRCMAVVSDDPAEPAVYRGADAIAFYRHAAAQRTWRNEVTLRSTRAARAYEPGIWGPRVSPTPLLMVVTLQDTITATDLALSAYEASLQPKGLVTIEGGHFAPYVEEFDTAGKAAADWFVQHLRPSA